jgi:hypothetical protein
MPARSSARNRKGEGPPEKVSTSKMLSRVTPSSRCCVNPIHQIHDVGKKTGESKTLPSIVERTPTPELSPSNSRVSSPTPSATASTPPSPAHQPAPEFKYTVREIPANLGTQKAFYNLLVVTLGLKSIQLRVNYNKIALVISHHQSPSRPQLRKDPSGRREQPNDHHRPDKSENARTRVCPQKTHFLGGRSRRPPRYLRRGDRHPLSFTVVSEGLENRLQEI